MKGRYALVLVMQCPLYLAALWLLLTALSQPLFVVYWHDWNQPGLLVTTVMGFEDVGLLYFIFLLALIALTASIKIIRLRWSNALRSTAILSTATLASAVFFFMTLIMWSLLPQISSGQVIDPTPPRFHLLEGFYTYCLSCILLIAAQALGPPIANRRVSFLGAEKTA